MTDGLPSELASLTDEETRFSLIGAIVEKRHRDQIWTRFMGPDEGVSAPGSPVSH
jgi:hypothetical protein